MVCAYVSGLEARAQRRVQRVAPEAWDGEAQGDDAEAVADTREAHGSQFRLRVGLQEGVVAGRGHQEPPVFQVHLGNGGGQQRRRGATITAGAWYRV